MGKTTLHRWVPSLRCDTCGPSSVSRVTGDPAAAFVVNLAKGLRASEGDSCKCVPQSWENRTWLVNLALGLWALGPAEGRSTKPPGGSLGVRVCPKEWSEDIMSLSLFAAVTCFEVPLLMCPDMLVHPDFAFVIGAGLFSLNPPLNYSKRARVDPPPVSLFSCHPVFL